MKTALRAGDPVIFLEPKSLLSSKGPVPTAGQYIPFGKARLVEAGADITLVSFGQPVHRCIEASQKLSSRHISCEILDLRTIVPLDRDSIIKSVSKTGRLLIVDEAYSPCSVSAEISAIVMENCFHLLLAPVGRLNKPSVPQPFSPVLEMEVTITAEKIVAAVELILRGLPVRPGYPPESGIQTDTDISGGNHLHAAAKEDSDPSPVPETAGFGSDMIEVVIPNLGLTITEVSIAKWHKKTGDEVKTGEPLLDFESEKSVIELESPAGGRLNNIIAAEGTTVLIGAVVGVIEVIKK
jgi:2-oxoisovalerate dehydrogenase E1 component